MTIDEAESASGPGELGKTVEEIIARARVRAPTRGNRRLPQLDRSPHRRGADSDQETASGWHARRGAFDDHEPVLDLQLRLGEGSGAALCLPLLDAALAVLDEMATFATAGVTDAGR